jgi:hypothetical protein
MQLSPKERQKIYLEEKTRLAVQQELRTGRKISAGTIIGRIALGFFGLLVLLFIAGAMMRNSDTASSTSTGTTTTQDTGNPAHNRLVALGANAQALALRDIADYH